MEDTKQERPFCKAMCWTLAIVGGIYLTYALAIQLGQDFTQSAVIGLVAILLGGFILRRVFCKPRVIEGDRFDSLREVNERAEASDRRAQRVAEARETRRAPPIAPPVVDKAAEDALARHLDDQEYEEFADDKVFSDEDARAPLPAPVEAAEPRASAFDDDLDAALNEPIEAMDDDAESEMPDEEEAAYGAVAGAPDSGVDDGLTSIDGITDDIAVELYAMGINSVADLSSIGPRIVRQIAELLPDNDEAVSEVRRWKSEAIDRVRAAEDAA